MSERLLTFEQVGQAMSVSHMTVRRNIHKLKAKGLQEVPLTSRCRRFRQSSLDQLIKKAAERSEPLF